MKLSIRFILMLFLIFIFLNSCASTKKTAGESLVEDKKTEDIEKYFSSKFIQHDPATAAWTAGIKKALEKINYEKIHKILWQWNFVLVMSEAKVWWESSSIYDLYRLEDWKIVEHWATTEKIPPKTEWKNQNWKF